MGQKPNDRDALAKSRPSPTQKLAPKPSVTTAHVVDSNATNTTNILGVDGERRLAVHHGPMPTAAELAALKAVDPRIVDHYLEETKRNGEFNRKLDEADQKHDHEVQLRHLAFVNEQDQRVHQTQRLNTLVGAVVMIVCGLALGLIGFGYLKTGLAVGTMPALSIIVFVVQKLRSLRARPAPAKPDELPPGGENSQNTT
jgi:hypothetical protein